MIRTTPSSAHTAKIFAHIENDADPSALVSSWRRCVSLHGLNPDGQPLPERVMHQRVIESRQRNADMTRAAQDTIDHLIGVLDGSDYMVFLTDADGITLETRSMRTGDFWNRPRGDWAGTNFNETVHGTNGVGTVLREGRPMTVAADQHFQVRDVSVICSGAPIYGLDGLIVGCLDISSSATRNDPLSNSLMLAAAVEGARRIELRMLSNAHPNGKLVLACRSGLNPGAILAVDRHGGVVGATRSARLLLDLRPDQLKGTFSVEQLWGDQDLSWAQAERRAIEAALAHEKGRASAAARRLGMSRSTLYRKMATYQIEGVRDAANTSKGNAARRLAGASAPRDDLG